MTTEAPSVNMMGFAAVEGDEVKVSGDNDYHSGNITGPSVVSTGTRGGADNAPDFRIRLLGAQSAWSLSEAGNVYLKSLMEKTQEFGYKCERLPRTNGYLFHDGNLGVAIYFAEHYINAASNDPYAPTSKVNSKVIDEASDMYPNINPLIAVQVIKEDYNLANKMAEYIDRVLKYGLSSVVTISDLNSKSKYVFRITQNVFQIKNYIEKYSPHGVAPHIQFGAAVELCTSDDYTPRRNENEFNWIPFVVVGAYVDFVTVESAYSRRRDEPRIQPVVHISAIESPMPSLYVLPVALAAAFQVFIGNSSWVKVFSDFTGKQPNIGSLLFDEELNRPAIVTNVKARNTFIDEQCLDAIMVLDVLEGRATIPGLSLLTQSAEGHNIVSSIIGRFFTDERVGDDLGDIVGQVYDEYCGITIDAGKPVDTRSIDYFRVIADNPDPNIFTNFLRHSDSPENRILDIKDAGFNDIMSYYTNSMCVFEPEDLKIITANIGQFFTPIMDDDVQRSMFGFSCSSDLGERFRRSFDSPLIRSAGRYGTSRYSRNGGSGLLSTYRSPFRR